MSAIETIIAGLENDLIVLTENYQSETAAIDQEIVILNQQIDLADESYNNAVAAVMVQMGYIQGHWQWLMNNPQGSCTYTLVTRTEETIRGWNTIADIANPNVTSFSTSANCQPLNPSEGAGLIIANQINTWGSAAIVMINAKIEMLANIAGLEGQITALLAEKAALKATYDSTKQQIEDRIIMAEDALIAGVAAGLDNAAAEQAALDLLAQQPPITTTSNDGEIGDYIIPIVLVAAILLLIYMRSK